jgi:hypothetical protein
MLFLTRSFFDQFSQCLLSKFFFPIHSLRLLIRKSQSPTLKDLKYEFSRVNLLLLALNRLKQL